MTSQNNSTSKPLTVADVAPHFQHPQSQSSQPAYGQIAGVSPDTATLTRQIEELTQRLDLIENTRTNLNTDIIGLLETLTVAPTGTPTSLFEQIKLVVIAGTYYIYAYNTNSKTWKRVVIS